MADEIKRVLSKYRSLLPEKIVVRELKIDSPPFDKAIAIVGPRKSGKTFLMYALAKASPNPAIVNFEDNLLAGLPPEEMRRIPDYSKELFGANKLAFFFDEAHGMVGWERLVISLLNEHRPVIVTGSNSRLLSREIASSLRGKCLPYLLLPLSFKEFLSFKGVSLKKGFELTDEAFAIKKLFGEYFTYGGFPEIVLSDSEGLKNRLVNSYFDSVLYSDLVDRLSLKNKELVEVCMKFVINSFGNSFSIASLEGYLRSLRMPYSLEDVYRILRALEDVFLATYIREYSRSHRKRELSKAKVYLFDTAYVQFLANEPQDGGRRLENLVFIELFRRQGAIDNRGISYFNGKDCECDFVLPEKGKAVQVCYELTSDNRGREIRGLLNAMESLSLKDGMILTHDQEEVVKEGGRKISVKPVWKWMLGV